MGKHSLVVEKEGLSTTGKFAAIVAGIGIMGSAAVIEAPVASADSILDNIAQCESGGNPHVVNGSGHGGLFQFDPQTWHSVGGTGAPQNATPDEQYKRAAMLMASRGTQPWDASKSCWAGKATGAPKFVPTAPTHAPKKAAPAPVVKAEVEVTPTIEAAVAVDGFKVSHGDTLSQIAQAHNMSTNKLFNLNRHIVRKADLIYPGQVLRLQ